MHLEQYRWVQGWTLNATGILFGGQMLAWVDEDTTMLAHEACLPAAQLTTGGFDRVSFILPCQHGDRLRFDYNIVHVGNKSLTILSKVYRRWREKEREERPHNEALAFECLVTMVSLKGPLKDWLIEPFFVDPNDKLYQLVEKLKKERAPLT